ncbi:MAG: phenylalanine--tRNA ligase subunit beta [Candidatus Woesearchaeota archaeon]
MPTVTLNKKEFEKLVGKTLPLEELKDRISMLGTDLESIEGNEIVVEVFPNRPDMLSEQGFARAFSSFIGEKKGLREYKVRESGQEVVIDKTVREVRPYTVCAIVRNLELTDEKIREIVQIQEKLHVTQLRKRKKGAIGIYPMEAIDFPITFCGKKPEEISFRPLEADSEMSANEILENHPTGKDYGFLLEGYNAYPLFIDAKGQILSMPPIVNSHTTGKVNTDTKDVFIECSGFDYKILSRCLNIIVTAFADMGGEIQSITLKYPEEKHVTPDLSPSKHEFDLEYINRRLGLSLNLEEAKELLERMGYGFEDGKVLVPSYRTDIMHMVDFVEDIAIAYGYENFDVVIPERGTVGQEDPFERYKAKTAQIIAGLGMIEINTHHLTNREHQCTRMNAEIQLVTLRNAISAEHNALRAWMIPTLCETLANNKHNEYPQEIFGFGSIFKLDESTETGVKEDERLGVAICKEDADFTAIKQVFDYLCRSLDLSYEFEETEHPSFIPGRVARVKVNGKKVAYVGELHPAVLTNWRIEMPVAVFELNMSDMYETQA